MSSRNKQDRKRKKSSAPILKFTFIVVLIVTAGFLIFYSIDNPGFLENLKNKFSSLINNSKDEETVSDLSEIDSGNLGDDNVELDEASEEFISITEDSFENDTEESIFINDLDENGSENFIVNEENLNTKESETNLSLWQKIKNFFMRIENKEEEEQTYSSRIEINFYFCGLGEDKKLESEKRTIIAGNLDSAVLNTVQELLKGPTKSYHFPVIPAGTKLLGVETYENLAKINLSQAFLENSLDTRILDEYIIYSIVNTLTEIPEVEGVIFYIEGERIKVYGNVDLSIPAIKNTGYISEE